MRTITKEDFDPEVYEFYKPALEGPGFDAPFTVKDVEWLREDEVKRHAAHTEPYEVYENRAYAENVSESEFDMIRGQSKMFRL